MYLWAAAATFCILLEKQWIIGDEAILRQIADDFSISTVVALENISAVNQKVGLEELNNLTRRFTFSDMLFWNSWVGHPTQPDVILKSCYALQIMYRSAVVDIRDYFAMRYLYYGTKEYEIGYITHDIIFTYQTMVELYHVIVSKYATQTYSNVAPPTYMFYIYTNFIALTKQIIHLCNALHEVEKKYLGVEKSAFDDYHMATMDSAASNISIKKKEQDMSDYNKKLELDAKKRRKERKKNFQLMLQSGFTTVKPTIKPKKGDFPMYYGWSIEDGW